MRLLATYYQKGFDNLVKDLAALEGDPGKSNLHRFRLDYKGIRATNKFINKELEATNLFSNQFDVLDEIFKKSGFAREIQINLDLLKKYEKKLKIKFYEYHDYASKNLSEYNSDLVAQIKNIEIPSIEDKSREICKFLKDYGKQKATIRIVIYLKLKIQKTEIILLENTEKDKYHTLRTLVKEELFFLKFPLSKKSDESKLIDPRRLEKIGIRLGLWHDLNRLLLPLQEYLKSMEFESSGGHELYEELFRLIENKQVNLLKNIDKDILKTQFALEKYLNLQLYKLLGA